MESHLGEAEAIRGGRGSWGRERHLREGESLRGGRGS